MVFKKNRYDAVVVGAGPNGLSAAINLSRMLNSVLLVEGAPTIGGGMRSAQVTQTGYLSDICSATHPLAVASPFFRTLRLEDHGVQWIQPDIPLAHPFEDGSALYLHRSIDLTREALGKDGKAYQGLMMPFVENAANLISDILSPLHVPRHPMLMARFALSALRSLTSLAQMKFSEARTRALMAGLAAHAMIPLHKPATAAFGIVLATLAHAVGWPVVSGGSQKLADALVHCFLGQGGEILTGKTISSMSELPPADYYFFDVTPRQLLNISGLGLSGRYRSRLGQFRYGPGVFKIDWALREPIPWRAEACKKAGTVHLGNSLEEINTSIVQAVSGNMPSLPYLIVGQPSLIDPSRAPVGRHVAWAYCHVPSGSTENISDQIEKRIERYAPGFREIILGRSHLTASAMEAYNPNYVGGDISGGSSDWRQLFTRPVAALNPYQTSKHNIFLCSSSTPPGGGVHGLCGYFATSSIGRSGILR
jgi:phytoene dehydrogenase-like protein